MDATVLNIKRSGEVEVEAEYSTGLKLRQKTRAEQVTHTEPDSWEKLDKELFREIEYIRTRESGDFFDKSECTERIRGIFARAKALAGVTPKCSEATPKGGDAE